MLKSDNYKNPYFSSRNHENNKSWSNTLNTKYKYNLNEVYINDEENVRDINIILKMNK